MDKNKQKMMITGALLVVMVFMMANALFFSKKRPSSGKGSVAATIDPAAMTAQAAFLTNVRQSESARSVQWSYWDTPWGRDPFGIPVVDAGKPGNANNFILSGIVWDERMPLAIINEKMFKINDVIDGCKVKEIYRSSVKVVCDGEPYELKLFKINESSS